MGQSACLWYIIWYSSNLFFPLGYYNGVPADIDEDSVNTGGQCEEGIKLILLIGDVSLNPTLESEIPGTGSE